MEPQAGSLCCHPRVPRVPQGPGQRPGLLEGSRVLQPPRPAGEPVETLSDDSPGF